MVEDVPAAWVTLTACPAIATDVLRELVDVFAATEKATVPLPLPELPLVIVSQVALLVAVQEQLLVLVTATDPVEALEPSVTADVESE